MPRLNSYTATTGRPFAGPGYKISRSFTGAKYEHVGEASEEFIVTKLSINSKAVDTYVKEHSDLPTGIAVNRCPW